ncbi:hypothetical protein V493_00149 [Pseudogymnoascus sp. VKM F-4281 (FW-2241)]|nr:hypothetical protein V493_00149 [Pseudogymnoascus sp. VKM F-4281 (FW-2241)]
MSELQRWEIQEPYLRPNGDLLEGPFYEPENNRLRFVDIIQRKLHVIDIAEGPTSLKTIDFDIPVGVTADIEGIDSNDKILIGGKTGIAILDRNTGKYEYIKTFYDGADEARDDRLRSNDGNVDSEGRMWIATMTDFHAGPCKPEGHLFSFDSSLNRATHRSELVIPNSIGWSLSNTTLYLVHSTEATIYAYDFDAATGSISYPRVFWKLDTGSEPDGFAIDVEGYIWQAVYGDGKVLRISPEGKTVGEIILPTRNVTCCAFVGEDLWITTASESAENAKLYPESARNGGALYKINVGIAGVKKHKFSLKCLWPTCFTGLSKEDATHRPGETPHGRGLWRRHNSSAIAANILATMAHLYDGSIFTDRSPDAANTTAAAYPRRPTVFILLPGGWSGDMWHCAAATALCQSEDKDVIASWQPLVVSPDNSIIHGSQTYDYFHSIQIPALLARINKLETKFRPIFGDNMIKGTGDYLNKIVILYRDHYGNPDAVCSVMWFLTPETEEAANVSTLQIPPIVAKPPSLGKGALFPNQGDIPELAKSDVSPSYEFDANEEVLTGPGPTLHLWASTAITMEYLYDSDKRARRVQYLQEQLGNVSNIDSTWAQQARILSDRLIMLATQEGVDRSNDKRVVLFNYRKGDVNKQHDGNMDFLDSVSKFAAAKGYVVIALIVNVDMEEVDYLRINNHPVLHLYARGQYYDKRYTAAFWSILANELQGTIVQGLIGGRSGSMDIASFMGVNTCSFDEPIFGTKYRFDNDYVHAQGGRLLRLMSQYPVMSIVYVDTDSWYDSGKKHNSYKELEKRGLGAWLDRAPNDPHICPAISVVEVRNTPAGSKSLDSALLRMEHDVMGIRATSLRELLGLQ